MRQKQLKLKRDAEADHALMHFDFSETKLLKEEVVYHRVALTIRWKVISDLSSGVSRSNNALV